MSKVKTSVVEGVFGVTHKAFQTDHKSFVTTFIKADSAKAALAKFNALVTTHYDYPYMWEEAELNNVEPLRAID